MKDTILNNFKHRVSGGSKDNLRVNTYLIMFLYSCSINSRNSSRVLFLLLLLSNHWKTSTNISPISKPVSKARLLAPLLAVLWIIWHGHPLTYTELFFSRTQVIIELFIPRLTDVLLGSCCFFTISLYTMRLNTSVNRLVRLCKTV